ncbi:MAG TPA: ribose-phosphate pyrophosphokinase [Chloroflexota bacterium]|nr:ribose-phosphate pyrophosphokinase [Chloroflexota bacterium]
MMEYERQLQLFSGNSNMALARNVAKCLGIPLGSALVGQFANAETRIRIEENVRGSDVFVLQSLSIPVDHNIIELLLMIDALKRASARRITAVIPYYAYAKQEKKMAGREPISAKLVANMLTTAGVSRVLTIDLHAPAIEGFFDIPVDHLRAAPILVDHFRKLGSDNMVVVSPDAGGVGRANDFRQRLAAPLAIIAKQRPRPDVAEVLEMVGDVRGKTAVIFDDMISTGGTMIEAADVLRARGAVDVLACATHPVFANGALDALLDSALSELVITDTVPLPDDRSDPKIRVVTVAPLLAESIRRIHENRSVSELFD